MRRALCLSLIVVMTFFRASFALTEGAFSRDGIASEKYCELAPRSLFSVASQVPNSRAAHDRFFELHPEVTRIGLVVFDDPEWGTAYMAIWRDIAAKRGITIVDTFLNNEWQPDFKTALTRMISKNPDAILFAHEPEGMMKAAHQLRFDKPILAANNVLEMLADKEESRARSILLRLAALATAQAGSYLGL